MAGKLSRCGQNLGAWRRNLCGGGSASTTVYLAGSGRAEKGELPPEFESPSFPEASAFALPGHSQTQAAYRASRLPWVKTQAWAKASDVLRSESREQQHVATLHHFTKGELDSGERRMEGARSLEEVALGVAGLGLEAKAQDIPDILRAELLRLFPGQDVRTALTLTQRTGTEQSAWSPAMEAERDSLTADFVTLASRVVEELRAAGFWADFIDPSSGRPYLGPFTQASLFQSDDAYRHFGFAVEDLGCCKVISHPTWGTKIFVGSIFTNAPLDHGSVSSILQRTNTARPNESTAEAQSNP